MCIRDSIKTVKARLEKVKRQRGTQRKARERRGSFRVSLVGYTNAGKSTLFNSLVKARAYAADQLFATLDTTTRALWLGQAQAAVSLSDTVGFIRDLPHKLVEAFEATLQEAAEADLLLHVIDAASPLLADSLQSRVPSDWLEAHPGVRRQRVFVSARTGQGLDVLRQAIAEHALAHLNGAAAAPNFTLPDGSLAVASLSDLEPDAAFPPHQHA